MTQDSGHKIQDAQPLKPLKRIELDIMKQQALKRADAEYYDTQSKHYRDNERYSWAVKTINERFARDLTSIND